MYKRKVLLNRTIFIGEDFFFFISQFPTLFFIFIEFIKLSFQVSLILMQNITTKLNIVDSRNNADALQFDNYFDSYNISNLSEIFNKFDTLNTFWQRICHMVTPLDDVLMR